MKNLIDNNLQQKFNIINNAIAVSKTILPSVSERTNKILDMHKKSVDMYFDKIGEDLSDAVAKKNFY